MVAIKMYEPRFNGLRDSMITILLHFFINQFFMQLLKIDSRFRGNDSE